MMRLVVLEDDTLQLDWLVDELRRRYPAADIDAYKTESDFVGAMDRFASQPPILFLLDVFVRWDVPRRAPIRPPDDVQREGYYRAGIRCTSRLRAAGVRTPIILYTILDRVDLTDDLKRLCESSATLVHVQKTSNSDELFKEMARLLAVRRPSST